MNSALIHTALANNPGPIVSQAPQAWPAAMSLVGVYRPEPPPWETLGPKQPIRWPDAIASWGALDRVSDNGWFGPRRSGLTALAGDNLDDNLLIDLLAVRPLSGKKPIGQK